MKSFLLIYHHYWMSSKYFEHKLHLCKDSNEAYDIGSAYAYQNSSTFNHVDFTVIELAKDVRTTKLSWSERFSGILNHNMQTKNIKFIVDKRSVLCKTE